MALPGRDVPRGAVTLQTPPRALCRAMAGAFGAAVVQGRMCGAASLSPGCPAALPLRRQLGACVRTASVPSRELRVPRAALQVASGGARGLPGLGDLGPVPVLGTQTTPGFSQGWGDRQHPWLLRNPGSLRFQLGRQGSTAPHLSWAASCPLQVCWVRPPPSWGPLPPLSGRSRVPGLSLGVVAGFLWLISHPASAGSLSHRRLLRGRARVRSIPAALQVCRERWSLAPRPAGGRVQGSGASGLCFVSGSPIPPQGCGFSFSTSCTSRGASPVSGSWLLPWNFRLRNAHLTFTLAPCLSLYLEPSFQLPQHFRAEASGGLQGESRHLSS